MEIINDESAKMTFSDSVVKKVEQYRQFTKAAELISNFELKIPTKE